MNCYFDSRHPFKIGYGLLKVSSANTGSGTVMKDHMEIIHLVCFTVIWTITWVIPLKPLPRALEVATGIFPFGAFGLRVFAGFFAGVPHGDPIGDYARPLTDWVNGTGNPPYQLVLDTTVALGLLWFAATFHIPWRSRIATAWVLPAVAALSIASLLAENLSLQDYLATRLPAPALALTLSLALGVIMRWTPGPHTTTTRQAAAITMIIIIPVATFFLALLTPVITYMPPSQQAQVRSLLTLGAGFVTAAVGYRFNPFTASRSRLLFALVVGASAGATGSLYL